MLLWTVILTRKSLRITSNALVLCVSGADLIVSICNLPTTLYTVAYCYGEWRLGRKACVAFGFLNMLTFIGSVISLAAISLNRYIFIVRHTKFKKIYTKGHTGLIILGRSIMSPGFVGDSL